MYKKMLSLFFSCLSMYKNEYFICFSLRVNFYLFRFVLKYYYYNYNMERICRYDSASLVISSMVRSIRFASSGTCNLLGCCCCFVKFSGLVLFVFVSVVDIVVFFVQSYSLEVVVEILSCYEKS